MNHQRSNQRMNVSYTVQVQYKQYVLGYQLIIYQCHSTAADQGLQVSLLVALSFLHVAPLPARGDYTLCLSV